MVGASCRIPGAASLVEFWRLLVEEKNAIRKAPSGRWSVERFLRPGEPSPGFSYSFAGGYLDDPFLFDPVPFGLSSREVAQTDPQQRLLLELVWQAFEDAGVFPANLKAKKVGVYVGASSVDYQGAAALDASIIGSHFMTGNSLSVLANRISYVFDFHGPSLAVDSACSSAISALQLAIAALEANAIDFAVVGGVNLLLSPIPFIGFAQARMMSPTGLSRPFSADADGYVRAEGGAVVLLSRGDDAARLGLRVRSYILGCAVNSDGRTSGIALPSSDGQSELIGSLYDSVGMDPQGLAFVEAHGTGTPAGDPIEALALGEALGRRRSTPLPIGSVKSNVGHLESASGLVSLLKASLALEHAMLPRSLFSENLNRSIDFAGLNLQVAQTARPLDLDDGVGFAGVCNYGFGGTNAHVLLRSAPAMDEARSRPVAGAALSAAAVDEPGLMVLSAGSSEALMARALQVSAEMVVSPHVV
jgi:3-oxoacyl-(acyl-carrier-protein) synthase